MGKYNGKEHVFLSEALRTNTSLTRKRSPNDKERLTMRITIPAIKINPRKIAYQNSNTITSLINGKSNIHSSISRRKLQNFNLNSRRTIEELSKKGKIHIEELKLYKNYINKSINFITKKLTSGNTYTISNINKLSNLLRKNHFSNKEKINMTTKMSRIELVLKQKIQQYKEDLAKIKNLFNKKMKKDGNRYILNMSNQNKTILIDIEQKLNKKLKYAQWIHPITTWILILAIVSFTRIKME